MDHSKKSSTQASPVLFGGACGIGRGRKHPGSQALEGLARQFAETVSRFKLAAA
jgi:hypothetical protein